MSFENPGDGLRCDHCNQSGEATKPRADDMPLIRNRGERLCWPCNQRSTQLDHDELFAAMRPIVLSPEVERWHEQNPPRKALSGRKGGAR